MSLAPGGQGDAAPAPAQAPQRTRVAAAPPAAASTTAHASGGGSFVQVTSRRSEAEAQADFRAMQAKFPDQLGGREPVIRRADLGEKGTYFRALVGPFGSAEEAAQLCGGLKAAGGNCIVQRN
jgi:cell division protein FtsN